MCGGRFRETRQMLGPETSTDQHGMTKVCFCGLCLIFVVFEFRLVDWRIRFHYATAAMARRRRLHHRYCDKLSFLSLLCAAISGFILLELFYTEVSENFRWFDLQLLVR